MVEQRREPVIGTDDAVGTWICVTIGAIVPIYNASQAQSRKTMKLIQKIKVSAPARLHLGFVGLLDQSASRYGAVGLAIDHPAIVLEADRDTAWKTSGLAQEKVRRYVNNLSTSLALKQAVQINVVDDIPEHVGLGSGTQLAMSVASACTLLNDTRLSPARLSGLLGRGARSGIGTAAFAQGGFLVDCNAKSDVEARAIAARVEFPARCRIVLVFDDSYQGIHDEPETIAFENLGAFTPELSSTLHSILLDQVLPSLQQRDITHFGRGISSIQKKVGDFFSAVQGGRFLSPQVAEILDYAERNNAVGIGQSSWGPTGFIIVENETVAFNMKSQIQKRITGTDVRLQVCKPRNTGATIDIVDCDVEPQAALSSEAS